MQLRLIDGLKGSSNPTPAAPHIEKNAITIDGQEAAGSPEILNKIDHPNKKVGSPTGNASPVGWAELAALSTGKKRI